MIMINRTLLIPTLAALAILASCGPKTVSTRRAVADDQPDGGAYTEKTVPVVTKVAPDGQVTLRFYNDLPDVAYISAADFQSIVLPGSTMVVTHTGVGEYTLDNAGAKAVVNVNKDVFISSDFNEFTNMMGLLQPGMANVYYDGMPFVRYKSIKNFPSTATVTSMRTERGPCISPSRPWQTFIQIFSTITPASTVRRWSPTPLSMR